MFLLNSKSKDKKSRREGPEGIELFTWPSILCAWFPPKEHVL